MTSRLRRRLRAAGAPFFPLEWDDVVQSTNQAWILNFGVKREFSERNLRFEGEVEDEALVAVGGRAELGF
ncbi:MAG: hypothetical protein ACI9OJ_002436 [Myxococcota bacterium]|jgi:hypothetical protein